MVFVPFVSGTTKEDFVLTIAIGQGKSEVFFAEIAIALWVI